MINYYTQKIKALADDEEDGVGDEDVDGNLRRRRANSFTKDGDQKISGSTPNLKDDSRRVSFFTSTPRTRSVSESNDGTSPYSSDGDVSPPVVSDKAPPLLVVQPPASEVKNSRSGSLAATPNDNLKTPGSCKHNRCRSYF